MLDISKNFKNDTINNISSIHTYVLILPNCPVEKFTDVYTWITRSSDTADTEIREKLEGLYGSRKDYIEAIIKLSTRDGALRFDDTQLSYSFLPLLTKNPKFKNKLDLKKQISKVNNLTFSTANKFRGESINLDLESCNKSAVAVFWVTQSARSLEECTHVYTGYLDKIQVTEKDTKYTCYHLSKFFEESELPTNDIPYNDALPEKSLNATYPLTYGHVDGAFASVTEVEYTGVSKNYYINFDKPDADCEGFVDTMAGEGMTDYQDRKEAVNDYNNKDAFYDPNAAQMYIGDDGKMLTILNYCWFWHGGNPDSGYVNDAMISSGGAEKDVQDGYAHHYWLYPQYDFAHTNNGIRARGLVGVGRRRNPIANNAAYVQYKDNFKGVLMQPHEGGGGNQGTVPDGSQRLGTFNRSDFDTDTGLNVGFSHGDTNVHTNDYKWINNGDVENMAEFFDKGSYINRNAKLKFKFWTTYQSWCRINDNETGNVCFIPGFRGLRCGFESEIDSVETNRPMNFLHFSCVDTNVQHFYEDVKIDPDGDSMADTTDYDRAINVPSGTSDLTTETYPFGAATGKMMWFMGTFKTESDDTYGDIPYLYPGRDRFDVPMFVGTRQLPYSPRDTIGMDYPLPFTYDGYNCIKDSYYITTDDNFRMISDWNLWQDNLDFGHYYDYGDKEFYSTNRRIWNESQSWSTQNLDYDWWCNHGNRGFENGNSYGGQNMYGPAIGKASGEWSADEGDGNPSIGTYWGDKRSKIFPDTYGYTDNFDTTMMFVPIYPPKYNETISQTDESIFGPNTRSHIQHAYHELEFNDLYCVRQYIKAEFEESDFFAKIKGRKGYKYLDTGSKEFIENPVEVIYDILNTELGLGRGVVYNQETFSQAQSQNSGIKTAFSMKEAKKSNKVMEDVVKDSKVLLTFNEKGTITLDSIKHYYTDDDVTMDISARDVSKYKYTKTKLEDINNQVKIDYNKNYSNDTFNNTSGSILDETTGEEKFPIIIDGALKRSSYTQGNTSEAYSLDELTSLMYPSSAHSKYRYKIDYYNLINQECQTKYEAHTIRDLVSAHNVQKNEMLWNANQHLIIAGELPLSYVGIEVGDIIRFDKLIDNQSAFDFDYTERYIKNGQIIYPYFLVTSTDKSTDKIKFECIQLHRMDYGVDGIQIALDGFEDAYADDPRTFVYIVGEAQWRPAEAGTDDETTFASWSPSELQFWDSFGDIKGVTITEAYSGIQSVVLDDNDWVIHKDNEVSDAGTGVHVVRFETIQGNEGGPREVNAAITFDNGFVIYILIKQLGDQWSEETSMGFVGSAHWNVTPHTQDDYDNNLDQPYMLLYPTLQNEDGAAAEPHYGTVVISWVDDDPTEMQYAYENFTYDQYTSSIGVTLASPDNSNGELVWPEHEWQNCYDNAAGAVHAIEEPWESGNNVWKTYVTIVICDRHYRNDLDPPFTIDYRGAEMTYPHNSMFGSNQGGYWTYDDYYSFQVTFWKKDYHSTHSGPLYNGSYSDALKVFNFQIGPYTGEDPHPEEEEEETNEEEALIDTGYGHGDINNDSIINVLDAVAMVNLILSGDTPTDENYITSDINGDAIINVLDVVILVQYILAGYGNNLIPSWYPEISDDIEGNT